MLEFDIVIVGAGPAGLSLASEISNVLSVCLIDKNKIGITHKAWAVLELDGFKVPDHLTVNRIYGGISRIITKENIYEKKHPLIKSEESLALIDEEKVMTGWKSLAEKNGCTFYEKTIFRNYNKINDKIIVKTNKGDFKTNLLIDASGFNSKILKKLNIDEKADYYLPTYGGYVSNCNFSSTTHAYVYIVFECSDIVYQIFPLTKKRGIVWLSRGIKPKIFKENNESKWINTLKKDYETFVSSQQELRNCHLEKKCFGVAPMKVQRIKAVDNIFLYGDAGTSTTYHATLGFNSIFKNYKYVSKQIIKKFQNNELDAVSLNKIQIRPGPNFSEYIASQVMKMTSFSTYNEMIDYLQNIDNSDFMIEINNIYIRLFDGSVRIADIFRLFFTFLKLPLKIKFKIFCHIKEQISIKDIRPIGKMILEFFKFGI